MPELPEVENVRRTVERAVVGRLVTGVRCFRADVVCGDAACLVGRRIDAVLRHGKQIAIQVEEGQVVCVHLGMTGSLRVDTPTPPLGEAFSGGRPKRLVPSLIPMDQRHIHVVWTLDDGRSLWFRDPRRFGGLWTFDSLDSLHRERWAKLGPDALTITPRKLAVALAASKRPIKAALLDQGVVAGLGNIYVDELLFIWKIHPLTPAADVAERMRRKQLPGAVAGPGPGAMRRLLARAIDAGGTTLRDYVDAAGSVGLFRGHRVYGRAGLPCVRCKAVLESGVVAGRTTVWCGGCQG